MTAMALRLAQTLVWLALVATVPLRNPSAIGVVLVVAGLVGIVVAPVRSLNFETALAFAKALPRLSKLMPQMALPGLDPADLKSEAFRWWFERYRLLTLIVGGR